MLFRIHTTDETQVICTRNYKITKFIDDEIIECNEKKKNIIHSWKKKKQLIIVITRRIMKSKYSNREIKYLSYCIFSTIFNNIILPIGELLFVIN